MVIKINYTSSDVYVSTSVSPVYVVVNYSGVSGGGSAVWGEITGTLSDQTDLLDALDDKVPYTGATADVDLGEYELKAGQVEFDQTPTGTAGVGVLRWNDTDGTLDLGLKGGNVTLQVGQEQVQRVVNKSGVNLLESAYQVVKVTSAQGQRLAVDLAQGNSDANSTDTIGIVTETINNNQEGFITTSGLVREIDTTGSLQGETWVDGDVIYLSPTTAGAITNIKPVAPQHTVILGYVVYAHAIHGKIFVKCDNGYELDELHNVLISSPTNNQVLTYESSTSLWKNKTIATALGYTPVPTTRQLTINGTAYDLSADRSWTVTGSVSDGDKGDITVSSSGSTWTIDNAVIGVAKLSATGTPSSTTYLRGDNTWASVSGGTTIYTGDGTLAGDRIITSSGYSLTILGGKEDIANAQIGLRLQGSTTAKDVYLSLKNTNASGNDYTLRSLTSGRFEIVKYTPALATAMFAADTTFTQLTANATSFLFGRESNLVPGLWIGVSQGSQTLYNGTLLRNGTDTILSSSSSIYFLGASSYLGRIFSTTGNWLIQTGGTFTDAGYKLDINGTARVSGDIQINGVFRETVTTSRQTASYTLALTDNGKLVEMNVATANNLTVPLNSSIAFPIGTKIDIAQYGAGQTTIVATSGVTIRSAGGALKLAAQYSGGSLVKIATDEWYLFGDITV